MVFFQEEKVENLLPDFHLHFASVLQTQFNQRAVVASREQFGVVANELDLVDLFLVDFVALLRMGVQIEFQYVPISLTAINGVSLEDHPGDEVVVGGQ